MTIIKETRDLIALLIDHHTHQLVDVTLVTDKDHAHILEITFLHDTRFPSDHLQDQEILGFLDLADTQKQELFLYILLQE